MILSLSSRIALAMLLLLAVLAGPADAQTIFEKLVTPGELIEKHKDLEQTCDKCHQSFDKQAQSGLCRNCHKDVNADIESAAGFHGKSPEVKAKACKACHTDHAGRDADIVKLDASTFEHDLTDYLLKGRHRTAKCDSCHRPGVLFRKAPAACVACHRKDDKHKGNLGTACESCHNETNWAKVTRFDHARTAFPLEGAHKTVRCEACHAGQVYKGVPTTCIGCHKPDDVHKGSLGKDCAACHTVKTWKQAKFDHDRQTKFPLRGAHSKATCDACHGAGKRTKVATACVACHQKDDTHKGSLGPRCEQCHSVASWRAGVKFDHAKTRFPLRGLHKEVACAGCHKTTAYKGTPTACASCHADTVHKTRLGPACEHCHNTKGWPYFTFDHDVATHFALTGAHATIACEACHQAKQPATLVLPTPCVACHATEDVHRGSFGRRCEKCHDTKSFKNVRGVP